MTLAQSIALVDRMLTQNRAATDGMSALGDYDRWIKARNEAEESSRAALVAVGATVKVNWNGATIHFAGIRSTSTGGLPGAMGNWLRAARDRDARQRLEALGGNG
ncbi:MAG: hypothetical protein COC10_05630 [Sphingobium sp.]|nr:MAG: hypothetical protein COC10_05630 [Sphingobium sp.]